MLLWPFLDDRPDHGAGRIAGAKEGRAGQRGHVSSAWRNVSYSPARHRYA